jgi:hypothetical protein
LTTTHLLRSIAAGLATAAILAQSTLAAGEQKNQWPFTRRAETRATQVMKSSHAEAAPIRGEAKNQAPFTRPVTVVVASSRGGFSWADGGIGGLAGIGITVIGAVALTAVRKSPRTA